MVAVLRVVCVVRVVSRVPGAQRKSFVTLDRTISGLTAEEQRAGASGPVQNRLRTFGHVEAFVTGSFNEGSAELHTHLTIVARGMARRC